MTAPFTPRTPDEWFRRGQGVFEEVLAGYRRYGIRPHPELRLVMADSPIPYYEPAARVIGVGAPDATTARGRLYWIFLQHLLGAADLAELQTTLDALLPWVTAHELAHHLRHAYGAPIENNYVEEQVASLVACAFVREHERYRDGLPALREALARTARSTLSMAAGSESYLSGYRLGPAEVLRAEGALSAEALVTARALAEESGAPLEQVLVGLGAVSESRLVEARAARERAEAYFNRRYMANIGEYWRFGADWLLAELDRPDPLPLGAVLEAYVLTSDWEASRREGTQLLLEGCLLGPDARLAAAAAEALGESNPERAVPALLASLRDPRAEVVAAALWALAAQPAGVAAAAAQVVLLWPGPAAARAAAARILRLAGVDFTAPNGPPAALVEHALGRLAGGDASGWQTLATLLEADDETRITAALDACGEAGVGPVHSFVVARLEDRRASVRARAARALAAEPAAVQALIRGLADEEPEVRRALLDALRGLGRSALVALASPPVELAAGARLEALVLAAELGAGDAARSLEELGARFREHALALKRLESRLGSHSELEVVARAAGEARRRQARLALRALGAARAPQAMSLAERALDSVDPAHRASGRQLVARTLPAAGPSLARLLAEVAPDPRPSSRRRALAAAFVADDLTVRLLAARAAAGPPGPPALLARARRDPDPRVRAEANAPPAHGGAMLTTVEKILFLRSNPAFAVVEVDTLRSLAELWVGQQFRAGERIFVEGDPGTALYVITEGRVDITQRGETLAELGPRQFFGEMALFDGQPRSATATALQDCAVLRLDRDDFYRLGRRTPDLLVAVIGVLSERLRRTNAALVAVGG